MKTTKMHGNEVDRFVVPNKNFVLFHNQYDEGFVFLDHESIPLCSKKIRLRLTENIWGTQRRLPSAGELNQVIDLLKAMAIFKGPQAYLSNRVAKGVHGDEAFYYDMANGKAIRVTAQGWTVCDAPVLFRRYLHQKEQVTPIRGGGPWDIFEVINVEPESRLLFLVYLISCLVPDISHPVIDLSGDHGSGKTTDCAIVREVIDPSTMKAQSIPKDREELVQVLSHHYFPVFDNVSSLPDWVSDVFCQASTGGGLSKRKLFTDDEDVIYQFKRCVVLNGINVVIHKPDLLDRSILFPIEDIPKGKRKTDEQLLAEFEKMKPSILGGIFDTLAKAMAIYPTIYLPWTPRMADFAAWGFAIAEALEIGGGEKFLKAYRKMIDRQNETVIQTNALAESVLKFMEDKNEWKGTVGEAWDELYKIADEPKWDSTFPKGHRTLRKHLADIKVNLKHYGISYQILPRTKEGYPIIFTRNRANFRSFGSSSESDNKINGLEGERTDEENRGFRSPNDSPKLRKKKPKGLNKRIGRPKELRRHGAMPGERRRTLNPDGRE